MGHSQAFIDSVISFYQKPALSYSFEEIYFSNGDQGMIISQGKVNSILENKKLSFKLSYNSRNKEFQTVRNNRFYGCNNFAENYYDDYSKEKVKLKRYYNGFNDIYIFLQDRSLEKILHNKKYRVSTISTKDYYMLELYDDANFLSETNIGNVIQKERIIRYYISKKNYSIFKAFSFISIDIDGYNLQDSTVYKYTYNRNTIKELKKEIKNFLPIIRVKPSEGKNKIVLLDTLKYFPSYSLPDTNFVYYGQDTFKAKFVLIDFWYKGCGPCLTNMANVEKIRQSYSENELKVIAINVHDKIDDDIKRLLKRFNKTFLFLFSGKGLSNFLEINSYPTTIIYDNRTKEILLNHIGGGFYYAEEIKQFFQEHSELK